MKIHNRTILFYLPLIILLIIEKTVDYWICKKGFFTFIEFHPWIETAISYLFFTLFGVTLAFISAKKICNKIIGIVCIIYGAICVLKDWSILGHQELYSLLFDKVQFTRDYTG